MFSRIVVATDDFQSHRDATAAAEQLGCADAHITFTDRASGCAAARREQAQLLVLAAPGRRTPHLRRGRPGIGSSLITAPCAVAIVPSGYADSTEAIACVGVALDGSPESREALALARGLCFTCGGAKLSVIEVHSARAYGLGDPDPDHQAPVVDPLLTAARGLLREGIDVHTMSGDVGSGLVRYSASVDVLIVAARGSGSISRRLRYRASTQLARRCQSLVLILNSAAHAREHPIAGLGMLGADPPAAAAA